MDKIKLVAILRGIRPAEAAEHIETLIKAGFRYIEIPLNSPDWQQSIPQMAARFGEQAVIGAGTVLKVEQVDFLADAGAKLIVTPNTQPATIRRGAVAEDFPVFHLRPGLYSGAESGAAAGGAGAGGRRRDAGESGELGRGGMRRRRSGKRSVSRRAGRGAYPSAGGEVYRRRPQRLIAQRLPVDAAAMAVERQLNPAQPALCLGFVGHRQFGGQHVNHRQHRIA